jgi:hypothetical protein
MKMIVVEPKLMQATVQYLKTQPYDQVVDLINLLCESKTAEITDNATKPEEPNDD